VLPPLADQHPGHILRGACDSNSSLQVALFHACLG
jgi:hypothetical protein